MREEKFPSSFNTTHLVLNMRRRRESSFFLQSHRSLTRSSAANLTPHKVLFVVPFYLARARPSPSHFFPISPFPRRQPLSLLLSAAMPRFSRAVSESRENFVLGK